MGAKLFRQQRTIASVTITFVVALLVLTNSGLTVGANNAVDPISLAAQLNATVEASGFGDSELELASLKPCSSLVSSSSSWLKTRRESGEKCDIFAARGQAEAWPSMRTLGIWLQL